MSQEKEETRIVIVCKQSKDSKSNNVTVYTNNPHADTERVAFDADGSCSLLYQEYDVGSCAAL